MLMHIWQIAAQCWRNNWCTCAQCVLQAKKRTRPFVFFQLPNVVGNNQSWCMFQPCQSNQWMFASMSNWTSLGSNLQMSFNCAEVKQLNSNATDVQLPQKLFIARINSSFLVKWPAIAINTTEQNKTEPHIYEDFIYSHSHGYKISL